MITFLKKLHIHPLLLLFMMLSLVTGTFIQLFILFIIIFVHELGHYITAVRYRWHIQYVVLWVFGGVMQTAETTNRPIREDIIVTLAGPFQHIWLFILLYGLSYMEVMPATILQMAFYFNWLLLAFNLLPIYPLDGGKLLFYLLAAFLPYKKAHQYTYRFSIMSCVALLLSFLFFPFTFSAFLLLLFLLWENYRQWQEHPYIFMRFLLNRSNGKKQHTLLTDGKAKLMDVFPLFRRNRYHQIKIKGNPSMLSETEALAYYFEKHRIKETIAQLLKQT